MSDIDLYNIYEPISYLQFLQSQFHSQKLPLTKENMNFLGNHQPVLLTEIG
jgi:hypothetical protein